MENLYNRVDNLDDLIGSVKLPYMAWKVLFLVDKKSNSNKIADLLESEESEVVSSLQLLVQNGLIVTAEKVDEEASAKEEKVEEPQPEPVAETQPEVTEETEPSETSASDVIEESIVEEEEIEDDIVEEIQDEAADEKEEPQQAATEEDLTEEPAEQQAVEEAQEDSFLDNALDEGEEEIELLQEPEDDTIQEEVTDSTEEEKIEINIPEGEDEEVADEFNFNLTGEETATATEETPAAPPAEEEKDVDTSGFKKILVIDDSLVIRKMVEIALEEEEFNISTAVSGKEGLDIMDKTNPDLVILDMMLPDINGIEILKTIKASKGLPVIMLSGKDSPQMIETAKNEGAEEFLPKPFKDDDLVEKIKKLI